MTAETPLPVQVVDTMEHLDGRHPGYRRAHARGACFTATFTPTGEAAKYTTAAHLQGEPVSATVRFSNGSGNPAMPDTVPGGRGMATKFQLPDGTSTDLIGVNLPRFLVATPDEFLALVKALAADKDAGTGDQANLQGFLAQHPSSVPAFQALGAMGVPASFGTTGYQALHAFTWVNGDGDRQAVRYRWAPDLGEQNLDADAVAHSELQFLIDEFVERLGAGPVTFTLHVTLADPSDPTNDATQVWPADRPEIVVGTLAITGEVDDQDHWAAQIFDPTNLTPGIDLSDDPLPRLRNSAYSISYERRSRGE
ncbi:catalase family peroxidase [Kutzneria buriramensis]|uniref:Catalase-related peroxidase n=1 Tax=Kutzneria buriramensis TaxID=1045776 RepID=A0A3E0H5S2_9PSEU|nr:catalase family peroxidase [Kutzneria buriramensis]REH38204.1 catalase [Kutzneria buriramensis]